MFPLVHTFRFAHRCSGYLGRGPNIVKRTLISTQKNGKCQRAHHQFVEQRAMAIPQLRGEIAYPVSLRGLSPMGQACHRQERMPVGSGILPVIPNRQAGSLSHRALLAMTIFRPRDLGHTCRGHFQLTFVTGYVSVITRK